MTQGVLPEEEDVRRLIGVRISETIIFASAGEKHSRSHLRDLFFMHDWKEWEYWVVVEKHYNTGYGNPLAACRVLTSCSHASPCPLYTSHDNTSRNDTLRFPLERRESYPREPYSYGVRCDRLRVGRPRACIRRWGREPNGVVSAWMVVERTITLRKKENYIAVIQISAHIDNFSYAVAILLVVVAVVEGNCTE